ncbi:MAG: glycosyltransferase family 9 protein [Opitutaceae bacterium]
MSATAHRLWQSTAARAWAWSRPRIDRLVYTHGGLGDELLLTAVVNAARNQGRPLHVLTERPEVWRHNSDPASVQTGVDRWFYAQRRKWIRTRIDHLAYDHHRTEHIAVQMAAKAGVTLPDGWTPVFPIAPVPQARQRRTLVLHTSCRGARYAAETKEWPFARWQELAAQLAPEFRLIQLGTPDDPVLHEAIDRRGATSLVEAARCLAEAGAFVGLESGLMHLAAATGTPAVILYGGRTLPSQTGYPQHLHLRTPTPCTPCGLDRGCPHGLSCLAVSPDEVVGHLRRLTLEASP